MKAGAKSSGSRLSEAEQQAIRGPSASGGMAEGADVTREEIGIWAYICVSARELCERIWKRADTPNPSDKIKRSGCGIVNRSQNSSLYKDHHLHPLPYRERE